MQADVRGGFDDPSRSLRGELFRETPVETARRIQLGLAWRLKSESTGGLLALGGLHLREWWKPSRGLPPANWSLHEPEGLAGIAHDLSVPTMVSAYARGLYPMSHVLAPKWWAPEQRCVLFYDEIRMSKRMRSHIRQARYRVTFDRDFDRVIKACGGKREGKWHLTWITPAIMRAYADLHDAGHAHSFEVWNAAGELVGGGYSVASGPCFVVESQFFTEDNASKIGFYHLNWHLARWGFRLTDNKRPTPTVLQMGFRLVPRAAYLAHLEEPAPASRRWIAEADAAEVAAWRPEDTRRPASQTAA